MQHDPLTRIVESLDLTGAVFLRAEFSHPWAITAHVTEEDCKPFMAVPRQVIAYHVVTEGQALVSLDTGKGYRTNFRARAGDVIFLPTNTMHVLASAPGQHPISGDDLLLPTGQDGLISIRHGGGGERTRMLCGFMASNAGPSPLLNALPELAVINIESLETRKWMEASVGMAARKLLSGQVAGQRFVADICRLLLTEALRAHLDRVHPPQNWLGGMAHPRMAHALTRIHSDLSAPLRVEDLAAQVGMSRSAFVDRFTEVLGVGPRRYLLAQRMEAASLLLRDTDLSISEIASRVGYNAPEAFSRSFKREMGVAPADWRHDLEAAA